MNKYNIKAIRTELDDCVKYRSWNKFRRRFVSLLPESYQITILSTDNNYAGKPFAAAIDSNSLSVQDQRRIDICRAIIDFKTLSGESGFSSRSFAAGSNNKLAKQCTLLHALCYRYRSEKASAGRFYNPPVPMDIIEMIGQLSYKSAFVSPYGKHHQTPLALLLAHQAPPYIIERFFQLILSASPTSHDNESKSNDDTSLQDQSYICSLQVLNAKDIRGDTPVLQVIKRLSSSSDIEDYVRILVENDITNNGYWTIQQQRHHHSCLLIECKHGHTPLYYVVHQTFKDYHEHPEYQELPDMMIYMLLQTYNVLQIQNGQRKMKVLDAKQHDNDNDVENDDDDVTDDDSDERDSLWRAFSSESVDSVHILQAAIGCAHLLYTKDLSKLFPLLERNLQDANGLKNHVDDNGNTFLHLICQAQETNFLITEDSTDSPLLHRLAKRYPKYITTLNNDGKTPLHLAVEYQKDWKLVECLLVLAPDSVQVPDRRGFYPFQMAAISSETSSRKLPISGKAINGKMKKNTKGKKSSAQPQQDCNEDQPVIVDDMELTKIYSMLRSAPEVLRTFQYNDC